MIDLTTIKKYYLRYWVDRSQAARKAAEELAKKEVKPSLRDKYKPEGLVFDLNGKMIEFKAENEINPDTKKPYFSWGKAKILYNKPDENGWRLPTKEELKTLINNYPYEFDNGQCIFDKRLCLPALDCTGINGDMVNNPRIGLDGYYWSSTASNYSNNAYGLFFYADDKHCSIGSLHTHYGRCVRLVRRYEERRLNEDFTDKPSQPMDSAVEELTKNGVCIDNKDILTYYNLSSVTLLKKGDHITLTHFIAKEQGRGYGSSFMQDLISVADENQWTLALTPDDSFGATSVTRLKKFYKGFGFKDNRGHNSDFLTRESMIRRPE